jgi:hypothetical protein
MINWSIKMPDKKFLEGNRIKKTARKEQDAKEMRMSSRYMEKITRPKSDNHPNNESKNADQE